MRRHTRMVWITTVALAAAVLAAGAAWATIPGSDGAIQGCYAKGSGVLRVIDASAGESCVGSELPINWNQKGLKGDPGSPGAVGQAGPKGDKGDPGATGPIGPEGRPATGSPAGLDALGGLPCHTPTFDGSTRVKYTFTDSRTYSVSIDCAHDSIVKLTIDIDSIPRPIAYTCGDGTLCYLPSDVHGTLTGDEGGVSCSVAGGVVTSVFGTGPPTITPAHRTCTYELPRGSTIVLTADGVPTFGGWTSDCAGAGTSSVCTLTLDNDKHVGASWIDNS